MSWKPWKYKGFTFDYTFSAYFKDGEGGCPAYSMKWMAENMQHLRVKKKSKPILEEHVMFESMSDERIAVLFRIAKTRLYPFFKDVKLMRELREEHEKRMHK